MRARDIGLGLLAAAFLLAAGGGCNKSPSDAPPQPSTLNSSPRHNEVAAGQPSTTFARVHWMGIQQLGADTNATNFLSIWNMPESKALVAQTLDKLALALAASPPSSVLSPQSSVVSNQLPVLRPQPPITNYAALVATNQVASRLRPLLEDLVQTESYFEMRQETNQPAELALAIRLDGRRAELWTSNLTAGLQFSNQWSVASDPSGVSFHATRSTLAASPRHNEVTAGPRLTLHASRTGSWTLLGMSAETNRLLSELSQRISARNTVGSSNYWIDADVDLGRLIRALGADRAWLAGLPRLTMTVTGVGDGVRTEGKLKFSQPLPFEQTAWNIPTNLIYQKLISFTAIRGFRPWIESQKAWRHLALGQAPDQVFFWARAGLPFLSYAAAPLQDASNSVARLTERLATEGNAWMTTNAMGRFLPLEKGNGVTWPLPYMEPYLEASKLGGCDYVLGGLVRQEPGSNSVAPPGLFREVTSRTNLVAYDWELTGPRMDTWLYIGQLLRSFTFRGGLPPQCASYKWLKAAAPRLGNCATVVVLKAPDELSFARRSAVGLTSVELHLLSDWLESPNFPRDFSSRVPRRPTLPAKPTLGTNSVPGLPPR